MSGNTDPVAPGETDSGPGDSSQGRRGRGRTPAHTRVESRTGRTWGRIKFIMVGGMLATIVTGLTNTKPQTFETNQTLPGLLVGPCHVNNIEKLIYSVGVCIPPITNNLLTLCTRQTSEPDECDTLPMRTYPFMGGFNLKKISINLDLLPIFESLPPFSSQCKTNDNWPD